MKIKTLIQTAAGSALALAALMTVGAPAHAQAVTSFYFTSVGSDVPLTSITTTGVGQVINLSVYVQSTFPANAADVFVGYSQATTMGEGATRLDNKIGLNTSDTASSAVSNVNPAFFRKNGRESGGAGAGGAVRPYGDDVAIAINDDGTFYTATDPTHLFDISLQNIGLTSGSATISLFNAGSDTIDTSYLTDGTSYSRPATYNLTVTATPEPSQNAALGLGLLGLAGLTLTARRRAAAARK